MVICHIPVMNFVILWRISLRNVCVVLPHTRDDEIERVSVRLRGCMTCV